MQRRIWESFCINFFIHNKSLLTIKIVLNQNIINNRLVARFKTEAENLSSVIYFSKNFPETISHINNILDKEKIKFVALAGLSKDYKRILEEKGFTIITESFRANTKKIKASVTSSSYGIAESGIIVISTNCEDLRLATMLPDFHIIILKAESIVYKTSDISALLQKWFKRDNYTAFIGGPSRTADIERELTLGVHGPVQLHIIIEE